MIRNPDDINVNWTRPDNWPYEEDWGSVTWKARMDKIEKFAFERRKKYGFILCPKCKEMHIRKTIMCRNCGHKAKLPCPKTFLESR